MYSELRLLMIKNHVTMQAIARVLNIHINTVSKKINGKANFTLEEFVKIRNAFFPNMTLDQLGVKK